MVGYMRLSDTSAPWSYRKLPHEAVRVFDMCVHSYLNDEQVFEHMAILPVAKLVGQNSKDLLLVASLREEWGGGGVGENTYTQKMLF